MNNLNVRAKFIRIRGHIVRVDRIIRIYTEAKIGEHEKTYITLEDSSGKSNWLAWQGDIRDEIWDILQAGSDEHLDPHDRLREKVVL